MSIAKLKEECKRLGIKGYSNKAKHELEDMIKNYLVWQDEIKKYIDETVILGEKKYRIRRGLALHVDNCPINIRTWSGKSYANIIDDCEYCKYCLAFSISLGSYDDPEQFIVCGGKDKIENFLGEIPRV